MAHLAQCKNPTCPTMNKTTHVLDPERRLMKTSFIQTDSLNECTVCCMCVSQLDWGSVDVTGVSSPTLFSDSSYFRFPRVTMSSTSSAKSRLPLSTSAVISRCTAPGPAPCCPLAQWKSIASTCAPKLSLTKKCKIEKCHFIVLVNNYILHSLVN